MLAEIGFGETLAGHTMIDQGVGIVHYGIASVTQALHHIGFFAGGELVRLASHVGAKPSALLDRGPLKHNVGADSDEGFLALVDNDLAAPIELSHGDVIAFLP